MQPSGLTMKNEKLASFYLILASMLLSTHGRNILQDTSSSSSTSISEEDLDRQQKQGSEQVNLIPQHKLSPEEISYLVLSRFHTQLKGSIEQSDYKNISPKRASRRTAVTSHENDREEPRVRIIVRPVLTSERWLRLCRLRLRSSRFPGCDGDLMRDRQKREEMLRNNLAALLNGIKGPDTRQRLRMPSLRFG